jgi:hypothetical protein
LSRAAKSAKRILYLMGQTLDQRLRRLMLRQQVLLTGDPELSVDLMKFNEDFRLCIKMMQWKHGAVHRNGAPVQENNVQFAFRKGMARGQGIAKTPLHLGPRTGKDITGVEANHMARTELKKHFRSRIQILEAQIGTKKHHRRTQMIDDRLFKWRRGNAIYAHAECR